MPDIDPSIGFVSQRSAVSRFAIAHAGINSDVTNAVQQPGLVARSPSSSSQQRQASSSPSHYNSEASILDTWLKRKKGGTWRFPPFCYLLCRLGSALEARMFHGRRAPQERCVQLWCSSKPGGVMIPPELYELTNRLYSCGVLNASEE